MDFSFNSEDYSQIILGKYDFQTAPPTIYANRHKDSLHLLLTSEHEQLHFTLARQTSHGFCITIINHCLKSGIVSNKKLRYEMTKFFYECVNNGRALHESYATFGTLCCNHSYLPFIKDLPVEYLDYLKRCFEIIPKKLCEYRLARIWVYAAVLCSLSPTIPLYNEEKTVEDNLFALLSACTKVEDRWNSILKWVSENKHEINNIITEFATNEGYSQKEFNLPIFFGEAHQILDTKDEYNYFLVKESNLIKTLSEFLGNASQIEKTELYDNLKPLLISYTSKFYTTFRFEPILTKIIGLSDKKFGYIFRLFHENINIQVNFNSIEVRSLAKNSDVLKRITEKASYLNCNIIGFVSSIVLNSFFEKCKSIDDSIFEKNNIKFCFLPKLIESYSQDKFETLTYFKINDIEAIDVHDSTTWITNSFDYYNNSKLSSIFKKIGTEKLFILSSGGINFLNYLEWRFERNLDISNITFLITEINSLIYLAKYTFNDNVVHFQVIGESFLIALLDFQGELLILKQKKINLDITLSRTSLSEKDIILISFWKVFWH